MELRVDELAWFALLTPTDNGRYVHTCNQGHTRTSVLQQDRFQLLFQIGIHAIVDGYPREAVADFASSLERFFEFFYRFYCRLRTIPDGVSDANWASVRRQSERQLGLYIGCYLEVFENAAPVLNTHWSGFRNDVIHKGKIPTVDEAIEFGEVVAALLKPTMSEMQTKHHEILLHMDFERIAKASEGAPASTMSYPTFLAFHIGEEKSLRDAIRLASQPPWSYR